MLIKSFKFDIHIRDLLNVFRDEPGLFLLESSLVEKDRGRYSVIGFDPFDVHTQKNIGNLDALKKKFSKFQHSHEHPNLPMTSGMIGYIGYDYGLAQERIGHHSIDDLGLPDVYFGFYDCLIIIDHLKKVLTITSSGQPETAHNLRSIRQKERLANVENKLKCLEEQGSQFVYEFNANADAVLSSNFTKEQYQETVNRALDYIGQGDIYQVNLSQRFCLDPQSKIDPVLLYQLLAQSSPSSFGVYFNGGDFHIISSSPERFLKLRGLDVQPGR